MYDAGFPSEPTTLQRASGALVVTFKRREGTTVLGRLRQDGCLKARLPRVDHDAWTTAITINSSGGVAAGDRLTFEFGTGEGTRACVAGQAAERFYRSVPGGPPAHVRTRLTLAPGSALEWLPQETILFDNAALDRRLEIDMAPDAWFLGVESLVFGRLAMGEQVRNGRLRDLIRVRRGGELLLHDAIRIEGEIEATLSGPASAAQARAVATLVHVAPGAGERLDAMRAAFATAPAGIEATAPAGIEAGTPAGIEAGTPAGIEAGASAWNGMLLARILAPDSATLRPLVVAAIGVLREGRPLPRVWMC